MSTTEPIGDGLDLAPQGGAVTVVPVTGDQIALSDAGLMFRGSYERVGPDLHITGPDGGKVLIPDYFATEHPATLLSPNGAILDGDLVTKLAGSPFAGMVAGAGAPSSASAIGQVETVAGSATITHGDGTKVAAAVGTPVFEGDVVETGGDGRVAIAFADKTVASLAESGRMVLDKFVYDPGGSSNSMLVSIVHGTFAFVAGLVAPSGDMKVETPVATIGIRGTTGIVRADVQDGTSYFTLKPDPPGKLGGPGGTVGAFDVFSRLNGVLLKEVRVADQLLVVHDASGRFEDMPGLSAADQAFQADIVRFAFASHQQMLERLENFDPQKQQQPTDPNSPGKQGDATDGTGTKTAGLNTTSPADQALRDPLDVDFVRQTDPLDGETQGTDAGQNGNTQPGDGTGQTGLLAGTAPEFTSDPLSFAFLQQGGATGIHADLPSVTFADSLGRDVSVVAVETSVTTLSLGPSGSAPPPFDLTPEQIAALAAAFNPETGEFDLNIDTTFLRAGQQIVIAVVVTIENSDGVRASQTQFFSIVGINDAPTLQEASLSVVDTSAADAFASSAGALVGADPDQGTTLIYKAVGGAITDGGGTVVTTAYGTLTVSADGRYSFSPDADAINGLAGGASVHLEIPVSVSDGVGPAVTSNVVIDLRGANDAPTLEDVSRSIVDSPANDTFGAVYGSLVGADADQGAELSFSIVGGNSDGEGGMTYDTAYGTLYLSQGGFYQFTPNSTAINALAEGVLVQLNIPVSVSDGIAPPVTATVGIDITGSNEAPVIAARGFEANYALAGASAEIGSGTYTLFDAAAVNPGVGAVWQQVDLTQDVHWSTNVYFGAGPVGTFGGAANSDGVSFAFQNVGGNAIGGGGGGMGIYGISNAVGFKIDTYPFNTPGDPVGGNQFAQFFTGGDAMSAGTHQTISPALNDGLYHSVEVVWNATAKTLTYTIDGTYTATFARDIVALDFGGDTTVYAGFVGSGGDANGATNIRIDEVSNGVHGLLVERAGVIGSTEVRTLEGAFQFTDVDTSDTHDVRVVGPSGTAYGTLSAHVTSDASGAGRVSWSFSVLDGALDGLEDGELVTQTYRVYVSDGTDESFTDVTIGLLGRPGGSLEATLVQTIAATDDGMSQSIVASSNDDVIELTLPSSGEISTSVDGGGGTNALVLAGGFSEVDLTTLSADMLKNIHQISLTGGTAAQTLRLSLDQVVDITGGENVDLTNALEAYNLAHPGFEIEFSDEHALVIEGDHGAGPVDGVEIVAATANAASGSWVHAGTLSAFTSLNGESGSHEIYNFVSGSEVLATIAVHSGVDVAPNATV